MLLDFPVLLESWWRKPFTIGVVLVSSLLLADIHAVDITLLLHFFPWNQFHEKYFRRLSKFFKVEPTQDQDKVPLFLLNMAESFIYIAQFVDGSNSHVEPYFFKYKQMKFELISRKNWKKLLISQKKNVFSSNS